MAVRLIRSGVPVNRGKVAAERLPWPNITADVDASTTAQIYKVGLHRFQLGS
jgi:hypothetical protein